MDNKWIAATFSALLFLSACGGGGDEGSGDTPDPGPEPEPVEEFAIDPEYYGEWVAIGSTAAITLDAETKGTLTVSKGDPRIIHFQYKGKKNQGTYVRKWPKTSRVVGSIAELGGSVTPSGLRSLRSGLSGVASIEVTLQNLLNDREGNETGENTTTVETNEDGSYEIEELEPSTYLLEAENSDGESVSDEIVIPAGENDIGIHTLVEGGSYNFKTSFKRIERSGADKARFVPPLVADYIAYSGTFTIENIGEQVAEGLNVSFDLSDERIAAGSVKNATVEGDLQTLIINTIDPGDSKTVSISDLRFKPIDEDKTTIRIPVIIRDANGSTWNDYAALTVYKRLVNINLKSNNAIGGKILVPGYAPIPIVESTTGRLSYDRNYKVPYIAGKSYDVVIYGNTDREPVYSLGVDVTAPSLEGFTETAANEPDNSREEATVLTLGEDTIAYQSKGNFDFIRIDIPDELPENSEGISFVEVGGFLDSGGNGDNVFSRGETSRYNFSMRNNGSSEIYISSISISTDDEYLSLTEGRDSLSFRNGLLLRGGVPKTAGGEDEIGTSAYLDNRYSYFSATFSEETPVNHEATVVATLIDDWGNQWDLPFTIKAEPSTANIEVSEVGAFRIPGDASQIDSELNPGDSLLFNLALTNTGEARTLDVITDVSTSDSNVTFLGRHNEGYRAKPDLKAGDVADLIGQLNSQALTKDASFPHYLLRIDIANDTPTGHEIPIMVTFTDKWGSTWTDEITFKVAE